MKTKQQIHSISDLFNKMKIVDLTHTLEENIPAVPIHSKFGHQLWNSYHLGDRALTYNLSMNEHTGTHVDAFSHFIKEGESNQFINEIPLEKFCGPYLRMDFSSLGPKGELTKELIVEWEKNHRGIQEGDIVLLYYGWSKYWKKRPEDKQFIQDWPGVGRSAAEYLVEKKIKMIGVDTINVEVYESKLFPAHHTLLEHQIPIAENLNNLDIIEETGYFMAFPLPIKGGSGSPVRAVAFIEQ
ncbi:cyclase family protein [Evansella sp. AB-P1]|uniref:cyclase family protein n=1 Tax=Evansella sp. AB-P1 TaxID=3037653 RepID=UPI00241C3454|nr:cyclase family protein [Evansella sp. AB-P1]MDG5788498.1 cyclase family protein [Evansella sp. AB-P1]